MLAEIQCNFHVSQGWLHSWCCLASELAGEYFLRVDEDFWARHYISIKLFGCILNGEPEAKWNGCKRVVHLLSMHLTSKQQRWRRQGKLGTHWRRDWIFHTLRKMVWRGSLLHLANGIGISNEPWGRFILTRLQLFLQIRRFKLYWMADTTHFRSPSKEATIDRM
jgi:hypothetical protein